MARGSCMCAISAVIFLGFLFSTGLTTESGSSEKIQYCSFFNNRAPRAQPGLKNCTWFKDNSCCMQQEIAATFGRVKPLKGASPACQRYVNYLMCYICAPNQNIFYKQERLTVCRSFCDALYDTCNSAILKGSVIRELYSSGEEFCRSRRFEVATTGCFTFDVALDTSSGVQNKINSIFVVLLVCVCVLVQKASSASGETLEAGESRGREEAGRRGRAGRKARGARQTQTTIAQSPTSATRATSSSRSCHSNTKLQPSSSANRSSSSTTTSSSSSRSSKGWQSQATTPPHDKLLSLLTSASGAYKEPKGTEATTAAVAAAKTVVTGECGFNSSIDDNSHGVRSQFTPTHNITTTCEGPGLCFGLGSSSSTNTNSSNSMSELEFDLPTTDSLHIHSNPPRFKSKMSPKNLETALKELTINKIVSSPIKSGCINFRMPQVLGCSYVVGVVLVLLTLQVPQPTTALTHRDIENWASMLSKELMDIARRGLRYEEIQQLYDRAQYATEYVNGTAKVREVREKLGTYFVSKKRRALELAEWVRKEHDDWWVQSTQVKGQAGAWGHRWRRHLQDENGGKTAADNWKNPRLSLSELQEDDVTEEEEVTVEEFPVDWELEYAEEEAVGNLLPGVVDNKRVENPKFDISKLASRNVAAKLAKNDDMDSTLKYGGTATGEGFNPDYFRSGDDMESVKEVKDYGVSYQYYSRRRRSDGILPNHGVDPLVADDNVMLPSYVHINDLDIEVYKDADIPKRLPKNLFKYDRDFRRNIMVEHSTVKIPDDVPRDSQEVYDTIRWTAKLDKLFRENRNKDSNLRRRGEYAPRWQYFGSASGVHRVFPGHEWPANFIGFHEDYDPRTRPWYVSATSGPKNLVLVLDSSASMSEDGSMQRMKSVAQNILSTLTKKDSVNIVVSRSEYYSTKGLYYPHKAEVLSCHQTSLIPASTSNLKELHTAVQDLQPYGGSYHIEAFQKAFTLLKNASHDDCQSFIIFVTDGQSTDLKQRCSPGYYKYDEQNRKHYQPGELCVYDFDEVTHIVSLLQYQLHKRTHLFTFLTSDKGDNRVLPGQLACDNQGAMAKVTADSNTFHQMAPYFRFLEASSGARSAVWTAPYVDKAGLGLMVTVSVPVYSNLTRSHLGVVGIDVELKHIENIMRHELWGSTYAFVIDSEDGSAIIHPFSKPSAQLLEDPAFVPITHLETHGGEPRDFRHVLAAMMARETGNLKVTDNAKRAISVHNSLVWRPTEYSHYFYTDIPGSDFAFAFNLAQTDATFQHARDPPVDGPVSFLHEMNLYKDLQEAIPGVWNQLLPSANLSRYQGIEVTFQHSVVKLAPRGFCNAAAYMEEHRPSFIDIHEYINTFTPTYDVHCPRGTYRTDVRPDVKLTAQLEDLWRRREAALQSQLAWTYIGTMGGVMRIYPGVEISRDFDPTKRPWYHRSEVNRGRLVVSSVYQDSVPGMGKVVTLSRAIHKAKPLTPPDCTGERRGYGCPCSINHQCKSEYCYFKSCADDLIQGVVATDFRYPDFHKLVSNILRSTGTRKYCNLRYNCQKARPCEVRCYLVDDVGHLVYDAAFIHIPDTDVNKYESQSLATKEGHLFSQLLKKGIFVQNTRLNFEGVCKVSNTVPRGKKADRQWTPEPTDNPDDPRMAAGPIPPFQNEYSCMQQMVYYEANKTLLRNLSLVSGSLEDSPCSAGRYHFMPVTGTNLFLLVLDDYRDLSSPANFNCHITNRVLAPGAFHVQPNSCHGNHMTTPLLPATPPRVCHRTKTVPLYCGYSQATPIVHKGGGASILISLLAVNLLLTLLRH